MLRAWSRYLRNILSRVRPKTPFGTRPRRQALLCLEVLDSRLTPSLSGVYNTTTYPFAAVVDLDVTFPHGSSAQDNGHFHGTGALIDQFHVLTAGHMLYDYADGGFATSIVVTPAESGNSAPFGSARMVWERAYTGWEAYSQQCPGKTGQGATDIGLITLDTAIGDRTGWFGMNYQNTNDPGQLNSIYSNMSLNTAGYPGSNLYPVTLNDGEVARGNTMYHDFGRVSGVSNDGSLVEYPQLETHPGQSGSPVWFYDGRTASCTSIEAVEVGSGFGTRITQQMYNDFHAAMNYDATYRPPQPASSSSGSTDSVNSVSYDAQVDLTATWTPPSNSTDLVAVPPTATAVTLNASVPSAPAGQPVTFTAIVAAPGSAVPSGTVTFYDGATALGTAGLSYYSSGTAFASFSTSGLGAGFHSISAAYGGDNNFQPSTSAAMAVTVTSPSANTTMPLAMWAPSLQAGQAVTFTAVAPPRLVPILGARVIRIRGSQQVVVYDVPTGRERFRLFPFGRSFRGRLYLALDDVDDDGLPDLLVSAVIGKRRRTLAFRGLDGARLAFA